MNLIIYDYFYRNFGPAKNSNSSLFVTKYKDYCKSMLKSSLKALKVSSGDPNEIRYVAKALRSQLRKDNASSYVSIDHDKEIQKNLWSYVKQSLKLSASLPPAFDSSSCTQFFCSLFRSINPSKSFAIPSWIPALSEPSVPYDISPPSYKSGIE